MKFKYKCDVCGKQLRSKRALVGHTWLAHNKRIRVGNPTSEVIDLNVDTRTITEKIEGVREFVHTVNEELLSLLGDVVEQLKLIRGRLDKLEIANPGKPDNPGNPNSKEVKADEKKIKSDEKKEKKSLVHSLLYDD